MSFISVEPQSRGLLQTHSNSLLDQFDTQRRIITERYLAFFQERRTIEATYINSLRKLYRKATIVDTTFEPRAEPTTTRVAWDTVRDSLKREANTQQTFVDILDSDVIKPLRTLKETNDKTRKQLKEDLKGSAAMYADHAENKISKLQETYSREYLPQEYTRSTKDSQRAQDVPAKSFGGKMAARGWREGVQEHEPSKPAPSTEVSEDDFRMAIRRLNTLRSVRAEDLEDGYDCLEQLVFTPTVKDVLVKYMDACSTAHLKHDNLSKSTLAKVETTLVGTDTSNLKASFRRALSFSIPPLALYRNHHPGAYSDLIFGVPLVDLETNQDNVPRVMRMFIEEVEKRGLNAKNIYLWDSTYGAAVKELRRRFESEKSFSFSSTDNIHSIAMLLQRYLWDLPEPLFMLTLQDYRQYIQNRAKYTENDCSLLRSKIRALHPVHRASLEALLRHLLRVASHSDKNQMTVEPLAAAFSGAVLRGQVVLQDSLDVKDLVLEDLIQNVHTLFDERPSLPPPVPSPHVIETRSSYTCGSLISSPEMAQSTEVPATGSTTQHRRGPVDSIPASTSSSFSSLPSDITMDSRLTPSGIASLSLLLGHSSAKTLMEGVGMPTREEVIPNASGTKAVETLPNSTPPDDVSLPGPSSVAEWRLHQSRLPPHSEAVMIPRSPPESVLSSTSDFSLSTATSL